jgi:hypothetical protein
MGIIEQPFVQLSIPVTTTQPTIEIALTCAYYQQVGHEFKNCPFVDDKLKRLMREELKTSLQPMVPNTPTTHVVEHVQQTHTQPSFVATLTWPSVGVKPNTWKSWGFGVLRDS